ncbi:MAG: hypothetical protein JXA10_03255 [Anaerolineae bacterium]|nr:hypothetical protein [Anaerolineae bacterium]
MAGVHAGDFAKRIARGQMRPPHVTLLIRLLTALLLGMLFLVALEDEPMNDPASLTESFMALWAEDLS